MRHIDRETYRKYAVVRAGQMGLSVQFDPSCTTPHTTGSKIVVRPPDYTWKDDMWKQWYYELLHEIGHQREPWREWKDVVKHYNVTHANILGSMLNLQSDHAQEWGGYGELKGVDIILGEGRRDFILKCNAKHHTPTNQDEWVWNAAWKYDAMQRGKWNPAMAGVYETVDLHPEAVVYYDKLVAWGKSAADCNSEWEVYEYTKELLAVLGLDPEAMEQENSDISKGASAPASGEMGEEAEGEGGSASGDGDGDEVPTKVKTTSAYIKPFLGHDHVTEEVRRDSSIDYTDHERSGGGYTFREKRVVDFRTGEGCDGLNPDRHFPAPEKVGSSFASKVRKILQVRSRVQYQGGMQSGRIHAKNLWRTRANDDHIFKQKVENLTLKDTAVTLLVDFSGSMGGDKIQHATAACLMLNQAITRLGVKTNITGFSDTFQPVELRIKGWGERLTDDQIVDRFSRASNLMCQNADGESLMFAYHDLMQRPEKKKLLIVLSDGSPCSYGDGDDDELLYNVAKQIEKDKRVSLYGIGIQDRNVQRYYTQRTTISEAHELEDKLLDVVQKQILGS